MSVLLMRRPYGNRSGNSGVTHFAIGADFIAVQFQGSAVYVYDHVTPGRQHVEAMKTCALAGRGLGTYISQHVRSSFARKDASW